MRCPFFEEILVAFCRAYPVKKMVPSDRLSANCVCTGESFEDCPLFRELMTKMDGVDPDSASAERGVLGAEASSAAQKHRAGRRSGKGV